MGGANRLQIRCVGFEQGQIVGFPVTLLGNGGDLRFQVAAQFGKGFAQGPSLLENAKRFNGQVVILTNCGSGAGNWFGKLSQDDFNSRITTAKKVCPKPYIAGTRAIVVNDGQDS